jgi:hypothetical protein
MSEETFSIPEKLVDFLEQEILTRRWVKIRFKILEWGISYPDKTTKKWIDPKMFRVMRDPDLIIVKNIVGKFPPPDPKYEKAFLVILEYPSLSMLLYIGETKEGKLELIDIDVEYRMNITINTRLRMDV